MCRVHSRQDKRGHLASEPGSVMTMLAMNAIANLAISISVLLSATQYSSGLQMIHVNIWQIQLCYALRRV